MIVTMAIFSAVPLVLFCAFVILAMPAHLGETNGSASAERKRVSYPANMADCQQKKPGVQGCIELRRDGKSPVRGFIIEGSASHIALFDVAEKRVRALERSRTEVVADLH